MKTTIYTPDSSSRDLPQIPWKIVSDIEAARELAWQTALRDIRAQYRQSLLGFLWAVFPSLANSAPIEQSVAASGSLIVGVSVWPHPEGELLALSRDNRIKVQQVSWNKGRVELKPQWKFDQCRREEVHGRDF